MRQSSPCLRIYLDEIGGNRVLTRDEEVELFRRIGEGDEEARETVIQCNLKFVIRLARQFSGRGLPLEDLAQEGNIGLLEAIGRFDCERGFRFSTYSAFWIRQAMQVAVRQRGSLIRIPARKSRQLGLMRELIQESWSLQGRPPTEEELAERLEISSEKARELARIGEAVLSLDMPTDDRGATLMDFVPDRDSESVDQPAIDNQRVECVQSAMSVLNEREFHVIQERYGFQSGVTKSLRKISRLLELSQEGVRRIEQRSLRKMSRPHVRATLSGLI